MRRDLWRAVEWSCRWLCRPTISCSFCLRLLTSALSFFSARVRLASFSLTNTCGWVARLTSPHARHH
jgi:hypothetical protein